MKTTYKAYMDRQTVSPDLHSRLLALEEEQRAEPRPVVRPLPGPARRPWRGAAALAASLVLVVGIGLFAAQSGMFRMGRSAAVSDSASAERAVTAEETEPAEAPMWEAEQGTYSTSADAEDAVAVTEEPAELPVMELAPNTADDEEPTPAEEASDLTQYATAYVGDNSKVGAIAAGQRYPDGYVYDHIEIHSDAEPYGLDVYLTGGAGTSPEALEENGATTFELIGNLGVLTYYDCESGELLAQFLREP